MDGPPAGVDLLVNNVVVEHAEKNPPPSPPDYLMVAGLQMLPVDPKPRFEHLENKANMVRNLDAVLKITSSESSDATSSESLVRLRQTKNSFRWAPASSECTWRASEDAVAFFVEHSTRQGRGC